MPKAIFVNGCHGNDKIHIPSEFAVSIIKKLPEAVSCGWLSWKPIKCHGGDVVCVCTEFYSNMCYH